MIINKRFICTVKDLVAAVIITVFSITLFNSLPPLQRLDELIYAFKFPTGGPVSPNILLVEITQETLKRLGNLPLERRNHATILEKLARNPGNVIGIEIWFYQPMSEPQDLELARIAQVYKNVVFIRPVWTTDPQGRVLYQQLDDAKPTTAVEHYDVSLPQSSIGITAILTHFTDPLSRQWLEVLPVKLFRIFKERQEITRDRRSLDTSPFDFIKMYKLHFASAHPISLKPFLVMLPVNYIGGADTFQRIPYERFLGNEDFSWIRDKIIIIGESLPARGIFTPLSVRTGNPTSNIVLTANVVNNLLSRNYIRTLHPLVTSSLILVFCGLLLAGLGRFQSMRIRIGIGIGIVGLLLAANYLLFATFRFQMVVTPFMMVWVLGQGYLAAKQLLTAREVKRHDLLPEN